MSDVVEEIARFVETYAEEDYMPRTATGCSASWSEGTSCCMEKVAAMIREKWSDRFIVELNEPMRASLKGFALMRGQTPEAALQAIVAERLLKWESDQP